MWKKLRSLVPRMLNAESAWLTSIFAEFKRHCMKWCGCVTKKTLLPPLCFYESFQAFLDFPHNINTMMMLVSTLTTLLYSRSLDADNTLPILSNVWKIIRQKIISQLDWRSLSKIEIVSPPPSGFAFFVGWWRKTLACGCSDAPMLRSSIVACLRRKVRNS